MRCGGAVEGWDAVTTGTPPVNPPFGWDNPYQKGTMTRLSETSAVFEADGVEQLYELRPGATSFRRICS